MPRPYLSLPLLSEGHQNVYLKSKAYVAESFARAKASKLSQSAVVEICQPSGQRGAATSEVNGNE